MWWLCVFYWCTQFSILSSFHFELQTRQDEALVPHSNMFCHFCDGTKSQKSRSRRKSLYETFSIIFNFAAFFSFHSLFFSISLQYCQVKYWKISFINFWKSIYRKVLNFITQPIHGLVFRLKSRNVWNRKIVSKYTD